MDLDLTLRCQFRVCVCRRGGERLLWGEGPTARRAPTADTQHPTKKLCFTSLS